jgi:predicted amidohydrolase YtcJ
MAVRTRICLVATILALSLVGCRDGHSPAPAGPADLIFVNADVITMDDQVPAAQAVAVSGQTIVAVGTDQDLQRWRGPHTTVVDLDGRTIVPGFIDAHQYRVQKYADAGYADPAAAVDAAVQQGWTTLEELYADPGVLPELHDLDQAGRLGPWVDAYLPVMLYDAAGTSLGSWYQAYHQGQVLSPHVRVAGLIGFTDYDNATVLLWQQDALNAFLLDSARQGWSVALKTVSTRSLEMILRAEENLARVDPDAARDTRVRLEHALFITADQIARIKKLGLIPVINLNNPGQLVGESDVDQFITREPAGSYTPWRSLEAAGIPVANGTGWPSYFVDEPTGAPFGSPVHLLYQAVTRVGNLGRQPYPWLLDQTITVSQALRAMTIDSAYATSEEATKGSITPGKLADLVVLSADPVTAPVSQINDINVLLTMIGGRVAWCSPSARACPATATASAAAAPTTSLSVDPFVGTWSATDPTDGSEMSLRVSRDASGYQVTLTDTKARICGVGSGGAHGVPAEVQAHGNREGNVLTTDVTSLTCLAEPPTTERPTLQIVYTYDPAQDTLRDSAQDATWHRQPVAP